MQPFPFVPGLKHKCCFFKQTRKPQSYTSLKLQPTDPVTRNVELLAQLEIITQIIQVAENGCQRKTLPQVRNFLGRCPFPHGSSLGHIYCQMPTFLVTARDWWGPERPRACFPQTISQGSPGKCAFPHGLSLDVFFFFNFIGQNLALVSGGWWGLGT